MKTKLFKDSALAPGADAPKGTTWTVPATPVDAKGKPDPKPGDLATAIQDCHDLADQLKTTKTKLEAAKTLVETYAEKRWVNHWASWKAQPEVPVTIATEDGVAAIWIVQDKTVGYALSEKAIALLVDEVGALDDKYLAKQTTYAFDAEILALEARDPLTKRRATIMAMIQRRIAPLLDDLVASGQIDRAHADGLVVAETARVLTAELVPALPELCKREPARLMRAVQALGAAIVRFVKPA
jgi:hypothetical protein